MQKVRLIWQTNWRHRVHKLATYQRKLGPTTWLIFFLVGPQFARRTSCCIHCDLKLLTETMYLSKASTEVRGQMSLMIASEKLEASLFRLQSQISFSFYIQHMERLPNRNHWISRYKSQLCTINSQSYPKLWQLELLSVAHRLLHLQRFNSWPLTGRQCF